MKNYNFREYNQEQMFFSTINLKKLLPEDHPSKIINEIVERLNLDKLYSSYSHEGNPCYHPKMMLKILFYGYYTNNMSCRKIWDSVIYRADFMYLAAGEVPDFRTINSFRHRHINILPDLFTQIVIMCKEFDLISFENLAIDGEMIKANASMHKNKSIEMLKAEYEKTKRGLKHLLEKEIKEDFTEAYKNEIESKIKEKLSKIENMRDNLENIINKVKEEDKKKVKKVRRREDDYNKIKRNMTDEDAIALKHKDNRILPSYNHQSAVDEKYGVICAVKTKQSPDHANDLFDLVERAKENSECSFKHVLADCAFGNYANYEEISLGEKEEEYFIPDERYSAKRKDNYQNGKYDIERFKRIKKNDIDEYYCPEGHYMEYIGKREKNGRQVYIYKGLKCNNCEKHDECTKMEYRQLQIDTRLKYQDEMRKKLESDRGRILYRKRQGIVEPVHGDDQKNRFWIQHHLRGIAKAEAEFILIRIATNIRKLVKYAGNQLIFGT